MISMNVRPAMGLVWVLVVLLGCPAFAAEAVLFHAAPEAAGDGQGRSGGAPARFDDPALWKAVQASLQEGSVEVVLATGTYLTRPTLRLEKLGHAEHRLTIRGESEQGTIIREDPSDDTERNALILVKGCRNLTVRYLHFTGPERCGMGMFLDDTSRILIERCSWIDFTGTYYSGISVTGAASIDVVVRDCHFNRVGYDSHAHMVYTAYEPSLIKFINCEFIDSAGDYVRFRDRSDFGVVYGCTFRSTGTYKQEGHMPMVSMPLFNDSDPSAGEARPDYEYFGSSFLIANNKFIYETADDPEGWGKRWAVMFHHSGFDPPSRRHLLTPEEAEILGSGSEDPGPGRALLLKNLLVDMNRVRVFGNTYENVASRVVYRSNPNYGAESRGWTGEVDISNLPNTDAVVGSEEEAMTFFESGRAMETLP